LPGGVGGRLTCTLCPFRRQKKTTHVDGVAHMIGLLREDLDRLEHMIGND